MKQTFLILMSALGLLTLSSCEKVVGEGPVVSQTRAVEDFTSVASSIPGRVVYKIAPVYKVQVEGQQNILDILETKKVGDELIIKIQDGKNIKSHEELLVTIEAPVAESVNLSGSGEFSLQGNLTGSNLGLRVSGSGNLQVERLALTDKLTATISGSGNIAVQNGAVKNQSFRISGSGNIHVQDIVAENAVAEISGSGHIKLNVTQSLDATISGSGSVFYRGTPLVSTHISGSGSVRPL